jgi:hypothetical protein
LAFGKKSDKMKKAPLEKGGAFEGERRRTVALIS